MMETTITTINISVEEYNSLKAAEAELGCLYSAGVDNWEGYDYAMDLFRDGGYNHDTGA